MKLKAESMFNFKSTSFCNFAFTSCRFCEYIFTIIACNDRLCMREYNIGFIATSTFYIHEVGVWGWDKTFKFVRITFVLVTWVE